MVQTTIEVIDPDRGEVLARATIDHYVIALLGEGRAAAYYEDEFGIPRVAVMSLTLER